MKILVSAQKSGKFEVMEVDAGNIANFSASGEDRTTISMKNSEVLCAEMPVGDVKDAMLNELRRENQQEPHILLHIYERARSNTYKLEYLPIMILIGNIQEMVRCSGIYQKPSGKMADAIGKEALLAKGDTEYQPTRIILSSPVLGPRGLRVTELTVCEEMDWILEQIAEQQKF